jgi:hypothetical protein
MTRHVNLDSPPEPTSSFADVIAGVWRVQRTVIDHLTRQKYRFEGTATITRDAFVERGEIVVGGHCFEAERSYALAESCNVVQVLFPDGRPFARLDMRPSQRVEHHCGNDIYTGHIYFSGPGLWVEFWRVRGPKKRYSSLGQFMRTTGTTSSSRRP